MNASRESRDVAGVSVPFSSSRIAARDRRALRYLGCNDSEAISIEQCVFFDGLISFSYEC
jgi:hypothetical protein